MIPITLTDGGYFAHDGREIDPVASGMAKVLQERRGLFGYRLRIVEYETLHEDGYTFTAHARHVIPPGDPTRVGRGWYEPYPQGALACEGHEEAYA